MQQNNEILIDYLDKKLNTEESVRVSKLIQTDPATAAEFEYLKLAIDIVHQNAIQAKVSAIRESFGANRVPVKSETAVVRSIFKITMRVAAISLLILGSAILFKIVSVNSQSVYNKEFSDYEINSTRGSSVQDAETEAYRNKDWNQVVAVYRTEKSMTNRASFLAAISEMKLNHFPEAISLFEKTLKANPDDKSFHEESEYYLALACLRNHQEQKGVELINKIKADTSHTYYPMASKIPSIDLKIIELKK